MGKKSQGAATNRVEAEKQKATMDVVAFRTEQQQMAQAGIQRAGYLLGQVFERIEKGQHHLDDIIALQAVSSSVVAAASRIAQVLKSYDVQPATADDKPGEPGTDQPSSIILGG